MHDSQVGEDPTPLHAAPFQLSTVESIRQFIVGLNGSCLDPGGQLTDLTPQEHLSSNAKLFTAGGSLAREFWADTALGSRIQGTLTRTATPIEMVDLCSMTCNTVLGINDPWVKLKQASFLLSSQPHYLPARIGNDLFYRVAHRILNRLRRFGAPDELRHQPAPVQRLGRSRACSPCCVARSPRRIVPTQARDIPGWLSRRERRGQPRLRG